MTARLAPEAGARFVKALRSARSETESVVGETADGSGAWEGSDAAASPETEPWKRRDTDALVTLAESYLAHGPASARGPDATQIVVHTRLGTTGRESALEDGADLPTETAERLACDAELIEIREDADGTPLDVGRRTRKIPTPLRRALTVRDGTCRFPGCASTRVEAHHMQHLLHEGTTSLDNLVGFCKFHRWVHEGGWRAQAGPDGSFVLVDAEGETYPDQLPWRGEATQLGADVGSSRRPRIDSDTCIPLIDGTPVQYDYVVDTLMQISTPN